MKPQRSNTIIIVVAVQEKVMGLVVDAVSDVLTIDRQDIQAPPAFGVRVDVSCLSGIAKFGDKLVALLDIDRLLVDGAVEGGQDASPLLTV